MTYLLINDYVNLKKYTKIYDLSEIAYMQRYWNCKDKLLVDLSNYTDIFKYSHRWSDLRRTHYEYLILRVMKSIDVNNIIWEEDNLIIQSLYTIIASMIVWMENSCDIDVDNLEISRLSDTHIVYNTTMNSSDVSMRELRINNDINKLSNITLLFDNS